MRDVTLFRRHKGGLADSMATVHAVADRAALVAEIAESYRPFRVEIHDDDVIIEPYGYDTRIGWNTWIVKVRHCGVEGFLNGPLSSAPSNPVLQP
jgi:hypothetical protein